MEKLQPILKKLKGILDHLEKIILGVVLIAVATISVLKLLEARKAIAGVAEAQRDITLSGSSYKSDTNLTSKLNELIVQASGRPVPLVLEGSNHMVFNPRKWKEVVITNGGDPILVPDSEKEPLGVSALQVTNIAPVNLIVVPEAKLSADKNKVLYQFTVTDYYPMQFNTQYGLLATFIPHMTMAKSVSKRLTLVANRGPIELHSFDKWPRATLYQLHRDWIVKVDFKGATAPVSLENADNVLFNLDVIYTQFDGITFTTVTNQFPNWRSKAPIGITRARQADFLYQTKYHDPKAYRGYRVGRQIMVDGECLRIIKITPNEVHLYSDLTFGGNGKLYVKELLTPAEVIAAGANGGDGVAAQPRPVPNTNAPTGGP